MTCGDSALAQNGTRKEPCCPAENHAIEVTNLVKGEEVCYSLLLIKGHIITKSSSQCPFFSSTSLILHSYEGPATAPPSTLWSVVDSAFKCLLSLEYGINKFVLEYCSTRLDFSIKFQPRSTLYYVTPIYIVCEGSSGRFQAPETEDNSIESACERISLGIRLIQTLFAEKLHESGYGRTTFQLEHDVTRDSSGCVVFYSKLPVDKALTMNGPALWEYFGRELMTSHIRSNKRKYVGFLSCTLYRGGLPDNKSATYEDILSSTDAHVALGGGGLALFGTGCLHTWPCTLEEVVPRFLNCDPVDTSLFMDDSCYRGTYGACFSTTLGSVCHELSHTFDLGHTNDGIMGHGYNNVHRVFLTLPLLSCEPETSQGRQLVPQHSTVSFTKDLNVTCTMAPPMRKPLNKLTKRFPSRKNCLQDDDDIVKKVKPSFTNVVRSHSESSLKNKTHQSKDDLTYWTASCLTMLAYHRWFNMEPSSSYTNDLSFSPERNRISSRAGVRVVELRDSDGGVKSSWEFLELQGRSDFEVPSSAQVVPGDYIVAEDSAGNILKHQL